MSSINFTNYHDTVLMISCIDKQISWNQRHGLPVAMLIGDRQRLMNELLHYEDMLTSIRDIRHRIALCCRYVLNIKMSDIAMILDVSTGTAGKICTAALDELTGSHDPADV